MYTSGTATNLDDFLSDLKDFCLSEGWTTESYVAEGTGYRYHGSKGGMCVNMRTFNNEAPAYTVIYNATSTATYDGLGMNLGTSYSGAANWYDQPGVYNFLSTAPANRYYCVGINSVSGTNMPYHFFSNSSGNQIVAVIEYATSKFQYLLFGDIINKYGTWAGGRYYSASGFVNESNSYEGFGSPSIGFFEGGFDSSLGIYGGYSAVDVEISAVTAWRRGYNHADATPVAKGIKEVNLNTHIRTHFLHPNEIGTVPVFRPVILGAGTSNGSTATYNVIGDVPYIYYCHMHNLVPGQQVTFGSDNYRVFPFGRKASNAYVAPITGVNGTSAMLGFAVLEGV